MSYVQKGRGAVSHAQRGMGVKVLTPISLEVSENGTIKAPAGFAYDTVTADVANTYPEADNYKVIHNGELFLQAENVPITANGTVDTKFIGSVNVNVASPVTIETIQGTMAAPWGNHTYQEIVGYVQSNDYIVRMYLSDGYTIGGSSGLTPGSIMWNYQHLVWDWVEDAGTERMGAEWDSSGILSWYLQYIKTNDYSWSGNFTSDILSTAALTATTLEILHYART